MFERFTEKARRVIFFARYEASEFGSPTIDTSTSCLESCGRAAVFSSVFMKLAIKFGRRFPGHEKNSDKY